MVRKSFHANVGGGTVDAGVAVEPLDDVCVDWAVRVGGRGKVCDGCFELVSPSCYRV